MRSGHCLCGQTRWEFDGEVSWSCYCHCDDCRRNCAAPVAAWLGMPLTKFRWLGDPPKTFQSSPAVRRHFCNTCGSPLGFEADHYPDAMQVYAASLDDPENFEPEFHVNAQAQLPWFRLTDELPKHEGRLLDGPENPSLRTDWP